MRSKMQLAAVIVVAVAAVACGGDGVDTGLSPSRGTATVGAQSVLVDQSNEQDSKLPPVIVPDGVSCPSDAPVITVTAQYGHLIIAWSQIPRVTGYQVEIQRYEYTNEYATFDVVEVGGSDETIDVVPGTAGKFRVRVRSRRCGGFGNWSAYQTEAID